MSKQTAQQGDWVKLHFTGKLETGVVFDESPEHEPLVFRIGSGIVIQNFENQIVGMTANEDKKITLLPEHAFGPRDETAKHIFLKSELPESLADTPKGDIIRLRPPVGRSCPGQVMENSSEKMMVDLNHPLAGHVLEYQVKLLAIGPDPGTL